MTIRSKAWLSVAGSVALSFAVAFAVLSALVRRELVGQAQTTANDVASSIVTELEGVETDGIADERDLALVLTRYITSTSSRYQQIRRLQLQIERLEREAPSVRIDAPRGEKTGIFRRTPDLQGIPIGYSRRESEDQAQTYTVLKTVNLKGPWKPATLWLEWSFEGVDKVLGVTQRWSLAVGAAQIVILILVAGFVLDRVVVRRLDRLGRAMRDVQQGDLQRRVPADGADEVGELSQSFNRMLEQLSEADSEIRAFNERLAREIEAATTDLSKKNLALAQTNRLLNDLRRENASKVRLATLGQLAAQLAHEIGTPLSSVSGHLQLALLQKDLPGGLRERLEVATREIGRIGRIVRDYLDSTRSLAPERKQTSLARVLSEAVEVTRGVDQRRAAIDMVIGDEPAEFFTDPGLLRQIVINLLTNALDAVERGGQVTLRTRSEGDDVFVIISDTGSGIAPEDLRRIFEPFYTTKGRGKGTGLGLAICRELTAALGGQISVESVAGKGSTFTIRLPRLGVPAGAEPRPLASAGGSA